MHIESFRKSDDVEKTCGKCHHLGGVMCSRCWNQNLDEDVCDYFTKKENK